MSADPTDAGLVALAARCEAASGPDTDLDLVIAENIGGRERVMNAVSPDEPYWTWRWTARDGTLTCGARYVAIPRVTASLDAALALVGEKLPGWFVNDLSDRRHNVECGDWTVQLVRRSDDMPRRTYGQTPALALCAALLRALATAQERSGAS